MANNDDAVNIYFSQQQQQKHNDVIESEDGCSPRQKQKLCLKLN